MRQIVWILEARGEGQEREVKREKMRVVGSSDGLRYLVQVSESLDEY